MPGSWVADIKPWATEQLAPNAKGYDCDRDISNSIYEKSMRFDFDPARFLPKYHPDAVCLMTGPMYDVVNDQILYRQQFRKIHVLPSATCAGVSVRTPDPGCDMYGVRVCAVKGAGQQTVCGGVTGPQGCKPCEGAIGYTPELVIPPIPH
jgi:hypothetical protein